MLNTLLLLGTGALCTYVLLKGYMITPSADNRSFDIFTYPTGFQKWVCICLWFVELNFPIPFWRTYL